MGKSAYLNQAFGMDHEDKAPFIEHGEDMLHKATVSEVDVQIRLGFLRKVFGILLAQLVVTTTLAFSVFVVPEFKSFVQTGSGSWMLLTAFILSMVLLVAMMFKRRETPTNYVLLTVWTFVMSYTIAVTVSFYDVSLVLQAFALTTCVVLSLFLYTFQTKKDFSGYGPGLYSVLLVLIVGGFIQMFLWSPVLEVVLSLGGAIIFSLYIIYDLQMIMRHMSPEEYIMATISLYLDIINLFIEILRILNVLSGGDSR